MNKIKKYTLKPTNNLDESRSKYDWVYYWISDKNTPLKPQEGEKEIELINFGKYITTEDALKEFEAQGYEPAPSNYLVTLGIEYPDVLKEKSFIVSLDEKNLLPGDDGSPSFLYLGWRGERSLGLAKRAGEWNDSWWFAVVRKPLNSESETLKNLDTLTLSRAIEIVKVAGYRVFEEK